MQANIIEKLHAGHQGITQSVRDKHSSQFAQALEKLLNRVLNCPTCCQHRSVQVEPLIPTEMSILHWKEWQLTCLNGKE